MASCVSKDKVLQYLPVIERFLLICWLLKDFGWMTTNIYLGFPFGIISVLLHAFLLFFDPRTSYRFYNLSLVLWVTGNFLWMTSEFVASAPSSEMHLGPHVPLGGLSDQTVNNLVNAKTILFLLSSVVQMTMYVLVFCKVVPVPEDDCEDIVAKNEAILFFFGAQSYSKQMDHSALDSSDDVQLVLDSTPSYGFTLSYIENAYIFFWVSKDLFWAWGTGDLTSREDLAIFFESTAMCCGTISIFIYLLTSYLYRRNTLRLLDCITTILWIAANFVWMCGEFFVRYDNLQHDDHDEGDDYETRVASATLFCLGLSVQLFIVLSVVWHVTAVSASHRKSQQYSQHRSESGDGSGIPRQIEMPVLSQLMFMTMHPASHNNNGGSVSELDEDETVLF